MAQVVLDQRALAAAIFNPLGIVNLRQRETAERIATTARQNARSRRVQQGITVQQQHRGDRTFYRVTAQGKEAVWEHEGTKPHVIRAKNRGKRRGWLRIEKEGRVMYLKVVHHPGTKANQFLLRAARESGLRFSQISIE